MNTILCLIVCLLALVVGVLTWATESPSDRARRWHRAGVSQGRIAERLGSPAIALGGQPDEVPGVLQMLDHKPQAAPLCHAGIGVAMHGDVRLGLGGRTSTRRGLSPHCHSITR